MHVRVVSSVLEEIHARAATVLRRPAKTTNIIYKTCENIKHLISDYNQNVRRGDAHYNNNNDNIQYRIRIILLLLFIYTDTNRILDFMTVH